MGIGRSSARGRSWFLAGVILLLGGLECRREGLALRGLEHMVMVLTAGLSMVNVGVGCTVGIVVYYACARGWVRLWQQ